MNRNKLLLVAVLLMVLAVSSLAPVFAQDDALVIWADGRRAPILQGLAEDFEAEFGIPVEIQQVELGDVRDQLLVAGPAGEGPDIGIIPHDHVGLLVRNGAIVPFDLSEFEGQFLESALALFTFEGQVWGLPYAQENVAFVRNVDLVPEAQTTWEQVAATSAELVESGASQYGFVMQTGDAYHAFPIISAFGGYIFGLNDDSTFNTSDIGWNSEGGLAAAQWMADMYAAGLMTPSWDTTALQEAFNAGDVAMFVTGPWQSNALLESGINFSIDPIPGAEGVSEAGSPFSGGQGFIISAFSDKQLLAESFLYEYVATDEVMQQLFETEGRIPAWTSVDTSAFPTVESFIAAGANAIPMPAIPEMGAVWSAAGNSQTLISTGEDAAASFNDAAEQIATAIEGLAAPIETVTLVGSLQDEAGCPAEWDPACEVTVMTDDGGGQWSITVTLPAGDYEWKVALNGTWDRSYPGANVALSLTEETEVTFRYNSNTNGVQDSVNNPESFGG
ncbi:MAG: extracellular solute-binding protein [bacterium]|nr:extracellular solute-binding protein [bacterium]